MGLTTMELTVLAMPDMAMVLAMLDTLLPMVAMPTTERGLLTPSPRLMLLFSTELTDMVDMVLVMPDTAMVPTPTPTVPTPMPTDMASKKSSNSNQSRPPSTNAEAQKQTKFDIQCHYKSFVII